MTCGVVFWIVASIGFACSPSRVVLRVPAVLAAIGGRKRGTLRTCLGGHHPTLGLAQVHANTDVSRIPEPMSSSIFLPPLGRQLFSQLVWMAPPRSATLLGDVCRDALLELSLWDHFVGHQQANQGRDEILDLLHDLTRRPVCPLLLLTIVMEEASSLSSPQTSSSVATSRCRRHFVRSALAGQHTCFAPDDTENGAIRLKPQSEDPDLEPKMLRTALLLSSPPPPLPPTPPPSSVLPSSEHT